MAFAKAKYGLEYNPESLEKGREPFPWGILLTVVFVVALISLSYHKITALVETEREEIALDEEPPAAVIPFADDPAPSTPVAPAVAAQKPLPPPRVTGSTEPTERPALVRNLLARLEGATQKNDIEMQIDTLERLRNLPGQPAADLDDRMARRLGVLNLRKLCQQRSLQWLDRVTVKRGESLSRIASEHGATLASTVMLNGGITQVRIGQHIYVMKNPRFIFWVHTKARYADLSLNGKFFKRYYLSGTCAVTEADYRLKNLPLRAADRKELEMLLPKSTSVTISDI